MKWPDPVSIDVVISGYDEHAISGDRAGHAEALEKVQHPLVLLAGSSKGQIAGRKDRIDRFDFLDSFQQAANGQLQIEIGITVQMDVGDVDRFRIEPPAPLSWICTQQEGPQRAAHETQDIFFAL